MQDTLTHKIEIEERNLLPDLFYRREQEVQRTAETLCAAPPLMVCLLKFILNHGGTVALKKHGDSLCRCDSVVQVICTECAVCTLRKLLNTLLIGPAD